MSSNNNINSSQPIETNWVQLLASARKEHKAGGGSVLDALQRLWRNHPDLLKQQLEEQTGVSVLDTTCAWTPVFDILPLQQARQMQCVVLMGDNQRCVLAAADPWDEIALRQLRRSLIQSTSFCAAHGEDLQQWLGETNFKTTTSSDTAVLVVLASGPVVSFIDAAILHAMTTGASDVHFECDRLGVTIKHRLDGVIQRYARMDGTQNAREVISRIKVLSQLDITESRLPQDGRFRFESGGASMDLRVSVMPSIHGEDAVLRLLDKAQWRQSQATINLDALGFEQQQATLIRRLALEPSGMLLVTGPTGSGKTTTLYAVLSEINTGLEKIVTIEDPVEYELEGVLQIPVNERKGLTFAKGLRSILRHDPDRILVGEIRDAETAEIAVQASLTGHQVFTTVHANSIVDIMGRFRHFGLDMFGFTSSLKGVVVQRLVRKLCPQCRCKESILESQIKVFDQYELPIPDYLYRAVGCADCHGSGYTGRFVLAEVHHVDDHFRDLVTTGASLSTLKEHARKMQFESLQHAGLKKVATALTTLEELQRVVGSV